ncbi:MAG: asparagine synthase-related protein, partial [Planctomycetota bacterium]
MPPPRPRGTCTRVGCDWSRAEQGGAWACGDAPPPGRSRARTRSPSQSPPAGGAAAATPGRTRLQAAQALDVSDWLPNDLLAKLDRCLMAHGVE